MHPLSDPAPLAQVLQRLTETVHSREVAVISNPTLTRILRQGITHALLTSVVTLGSVGFSVRGEAGEWQSADSIRRAAEQLVLEAFAGQSQVTVQARGVDERIKLPACAVPLQARAERPLRNGQGTVTVACEGESPWKLFVPVRAVHNVEVVVAAHSLARGARLSREDLSLELRPSSVLPVTYLTRVEDAVGLVVQRTVPPGTVLVAGALDRPRLVERGSLVTLVAGRSGVIVKSEGVALEDATLNQRVRVRTRAGRTVEGTVDATGQVRVGS